MKVIVESNGSIEIFEKTLLEGNFSSSRRSCDSGDGSGTIYWGSGCSVGWFLSFAPAEISTMSTITTIIPVASVTAISSVASVASVTSVTTSVS